MLRHVKSSNKCFFKYIDIKRKAKETSQWGGDLVAKDVARVRYLVPALPGSAKCLSLAAELWETSYSRNRRR